MKYDTIIIGSGPAGLTAAIYCARYNLKTLVIGSTLGLITEAHKICNWPGDPNVSGFKLMQKIEQQVKDLGAEVIHEEVIEITPNKVKTDSKEFETKTIILATGTKKRKLNLERENFFLGKGISYCATCDAAFFKDKITAVVGGSDGAMMAAHLLAQHAKKVYVLNRNNQLKAKPSWQEEIKNIENIELLNNTQVLKLIGENKLEKIKINNQELAIDGLFIEIGTIPQTKLSEQLNLETENGFIKTNPDQSTSKENIFAAGDITTNSNSMMQMITAAAEGAIAANSVFSKIK